MVEGSQGLSLEEGFLRGFLSSLFKRPLLGHLRLVRLPASLRGIFSWGGFPPGFPLEEGFFQIFLWGPMGRALLYANRAVSCLAFRAARFQDGPREQEERVGRCARFCLRTGAGETRGCLWAQTATSGSTGPRRRPGAGPGGTSSRPRTSWPTAPGGVSARGASSPPSPTPPPDGDLGRLLSVHRDDAFAGTCVHAPWLGYGTRSSSILRLGNRPRLVHAYGPPCSAPYQDMSELLANLGG